MEKISNYNLKIINVCSPQSQQQAFQFQKGEKHDEPSVQVNSRVRTIDIKHYSQINTRYLLSFTSKTKAACLFKSLMAKCNLYHKALLTI